MKIWLSIFFLIIFKVCLSGFANNYFIPEWSEFCPRRYANISTNSFHYTHSGRYWSDRRRTFEERKNKCMNLSNDEQDACFVQLRELENQATAQYSEGRSSQALRYMMMNSMFR